MGDFLSKDSFAQAVRGAFRLLCLFIPRACLSLAFTTTHGKVKCDPTLVFMLSIFIRGIPIFLR
jgi:hypothetical protein